MRKIIRNYFIPDGEDCGWTKLPSHAPEVPAEEDEPNDNYIVRAKMVEGGTVVTVVSPTCKTRKRYVKLLAPVMSRNRANTVAKIVSGTGRSYEENINELTFKMHLYGPGGLLEWAGKKNTALRVKMKD